MSDNLSLQQNNYWNQILEGLAYHHRTSPGRLSCNRNLVKLLNQTLRKIKEINSITHIGATCYRFPETACNTDGKLSPINFTVQTTACNEEDRILILDIVEQKLTTVGFKNPRTRLMHGKEVL